MTHQTLNLDNIKFAFSQYFPKLLTKIRRLDTCNCTTNPQNWSISKRPQQQLEEISADHMYLVRDDFIDLFA